MWCKSCNIETSQAECRVCGRETDDEISVEMYWCENCQTPIIQDSSRVDKELCFHCNEEMKYMSTDLRPVFPEERLLLEIVIGKKPNEFINRSVWVAKNRYYVDGRLIILPSKLFRTVCAEEVSKKLAEHKYENNYDFFYKSIKKIY